MLWFLFRGSPKVVFLLALALIAMISLVDWQVQDNIPLGFLYLFPMLLAGGSLGRGSIAAMAALCTFLTEQFEDFRWSLEAGVPRDILIFAAFFCMGLFVYEVIRNRQGSLRHLTEIERESEGRREAEEQLEVLIESSPAAILTADSNGCVLLANGAAHRLLGLEMGALVSKSIREYLPSLVNVLTSDQRRQFFRTTMQCRGKRENGEIFLADVWFSTYCTSAGPRLAAMVIDASEELRAREEVGLHQLLAASRILVGAVSHEVRNVCGAIAVVHANLARTESLIQNKDFEALGTLVLALEKIAAMDLRQTKKQASGINLYSFLEELRIVIEPSLREEHVEVSWETEPGLPAIWADRYSLMQVFLNLTKNSERAMERCQRRQLTISARWEHPQVVVEVRDTGGGVAHPERLFRPFQQGSQATGLGLYLSRAFMRSFQGDLRYEPRPDGSQFIVEISPAHTGEEKEIYGPGDPNTIGGRSQFVPGEPQPLAPGRI